MVSSSAARCLKRLEKEKEDLLKSHKDELTLDVENEKKWFISFKGAKGSIYDGEEYKLQFRFSDNYVRFIINDKAN